MTRALRLLRSILISITLVIARSTPLAIRIARLIPVRTALFIARSTPFRFARSIPVLVAIPIALAFAAPGVTAQDGGPARRAVMVPVETALSADTVTVGDRFAAVVTAWFPPGSWLEMEAPADSGRVQFIAPPRTSVIDSTSGRMRVDLRMVAWRTDLPDTLLVHARMVMPDGTSRAIVTVIRLPHVRSVLPADTTKHVPRGPKDVWGPSRPWTAIAILAAILFLLLFLAILAWVWIRRRGRRRSAQSYRTPREAALAMLEEARTSGLAEAGEWKAFYSLVSAALRRYAMATHTRWSTDLTTRELLEEMRADRVDEEQLATLAHLLRVADLAKFARGARTLDDARRDLDAARNWVERFGRPESAAEEGGEGDDDRDLATAGAGAGEAAR